MRMHFEGRYGRTLVEVANTKTREKDTGIEVRWDLDQARHVASLLESECETGSMTWLDDGEAYWFQGFLRARPTDARSEVESLYREFFGRLITVQSSDERAVIAGRFLKARRRMDVESMKFWLGELDETIEMLPDPTIE